MYIWYPPKKGHSSACKILKKILKPVKPITFLISTQINQLLAKITKNIKKLAIKVVRFIIIKVK